jgi:hypothetical protein
VQNSVAGFSTTPKWTRHRHRYIFVATSLRRELDSLWLCCHVPKGYAAPWLRFCQSFGSNRPIVGKKNNSNDDLRITRASRKQMRLDKNPNIGTIFAKPNRSLFPSCSLQNVFPTIFRRSFKVQHTIFVLVQQCKKCTPKSKLGEKQRRRRSQLDRGLPGPCQKPMRRLLLVGFQQ